MTNSKDFIIDSIKKANLSKTTTLPDLDFDCTTYNDKLEIFKEKLKSVGGYAKELDGLRLDEFLEKHYQNLGQIVTTIEDLSKEALHVKDFDDPHKLKECDLAIVRGEFGIAENGAVGIKEEIDLKAIYFIAKKLLIILKKENILNNMFEAYEKIEFEKNGFGVFISGPSKTADIEQALVIGAHGAMECCILLV